MKYFATLFQRIKDFFNALDRALPPQEEYEVDIKYQVPPVPIPVTPPPMPEPEKLDWSTAQGAFHATRVVADTIGLSLEQKNVLCACIFQESRFHNYRPDGSPTVNYNKDPKTGKVWSVDYGIVQVNDHFHIGPGKDFSSVEYVMTHPQQMVEWMARILKRTGRLQPWASYTSGAYRQWIVPSSPMWALKIQ